MALALVPQPDLELEPDDPVAVAAEAGLHHVTDGAPGIRRRRRGRGWSYTRPSGERVRDRATLARIARLAIPPAWTDVWICADPDGHLQATGRDAKGRKQYRYHDRWREVRDGNKFDRLAHFGLALPALRRRTDQLLSGTELTRERVIAVVIRLLDETLIRIGNAAYAQENESFGLTTLRSEHVDLGRDRFTLQFVGKAGVEHEVEVRDARLARIVRRCHELGGQDLFTYRGGDGQPVTVTSTDVNDHLRSVTGVATTAKDFRTWGGTTLVTEVLACLEAPGSARDADRAVLDAIDAAALHLGNTRAVCRSAYVHPAVPEAFRTGDLQEAWRRARRTPTLRRAERATLELLQQADAR